MADNQFVLPKWALLLFDSDGCTMLVKTSSLDCSDSIEVSTVVNFRHGKEIYKAEILSLAGSKQNLDSFEKQWEQSARAEAIQTAQYQQRKGGYLDIEPESDQQWVDGDDVHDIPCIVDSQSPDIYTEVINLKKNQALMLTRIGELAAALCDIRGLLDKRVKKQRGNAYHQLVSVPSPTTSVDLSQIYGIPSSVSSEDATAQSLSPEPTVSMDMCHSPDPETPQSSKSLSTDHTEGHLEDNDFSHVENVPLYVSTPIQVCCQTPSPVRPSPSPQCHSLSTSDAGTLLCNPPTQNSHSELPSLCRTFTRPVVNIGSVRNPVILDCVKYERITKLPTPQRF